MGGGGGGGISGYNYSAAIMAGLANGPIAGIGGVWQNKDRVTLESLGMRVALGTIPQSVWGYLATKHPAEAIAYPGLAYVATPEIFLGRSSAELPNLSFEVYGRTMSKTILDPGGAPVWIDDQFYGMQESDESGPLPAYDYFPSNEMGVSALYAEIIILGGGTATVELNDSGTTFTVSSGVAFDISAQVVTHIRVTDVTGIVPLEIFVATEVTPEISYFSSSVPGKLDADPAEVVEDFLTNPIDGAGFPLAKLGDLSAYSDYCVAAGLLLSPAFAEQKPASEHLKDLLAATNSEVVPSQGLLKIIPYGDMDLSGNGRTYTADVTPLYYLDDDHFLSTGEDPVVGSRVTSADAFNHVQIEFINRDRDYNVEIAEAKDQADIEEKGLRTMDVIQMHHICDPEVAALVAQLVLQRVLYIRNTYKFKLSWNFALLEPMDIVAITDPGLGLFQAPVRIKTIDEDEDDRLEFTVEEITPGISTAQSVAPPPASGYTTGNQADPGDAGAPVIFEPPEALCASPDRPEVWIAANGGADWGGCEVWISTNGETYGSIGFLYGKSRMGTLAANLPTSASPDTTHDLIVDFPKGTPHLLPGNQQDVDTLQTLCYLDGELLAYRDLTLVVTTDETVDRYDIKYLSRGAYGTSITSHAIGKAFVRLDSQVLRFAYPQALIGHTVKIKLTSFNLYGKAKQSLADVPTYTFALTGQGLAVKPHTEGGANTTVSATTGATVVYSRAFTELPTLTITILGATAGLYVDLSAQSATQFTVYVRNSSGTAVAASINWFAQGV